jgi:hypothetical protein
MTKAQALNFLRELLANGPLPSVEVQQRAEAAGFKWSMIRRAKHKLGIEAQRRSEGFGGDGQWVWALPTSPEPQPVHDVTDSSKSQDVQAARQDICDDQPQEAARTQDAQAAQELVVPSQAAQTEQLSSSPASAQVAQAPSEPPPASPPAASAQADQPPPQAEQPPAAPAQADQSPASTDQPPTPVAPPRRQRVIRVRARGEAPVGPDEISLEQWEVFGKKLENLKAYLKWRDSGGIHSSSVIESTTGEQHGQT